MTSGRSTPAQPWRRYASPEEILEPIDAWWERARNYTGQNFFVLTYFDKFGKPRLKLCREDQ